jgi:hypothetical protein
MTDLINPRDIKPIPTPTFAKAGTQLKRTVTVEQVVHYDITFLKQQRERLQTEIDEVDALLAQCEELGIMEAVAEPIETPPEEIKPIEDIKPIGIVRP